MPSEISGGALAKPADRTREILRLVGRELEIRSTFLQSMLPREVTPDRLRAFSLTAMQRTPRLQECAKTEAGMHSLLGAVYECARAGLDPDGIDCVILPYRRDGIHIAQFQLMFRGGMKLARRAGEVVQIWADVVREHDHFVETRGADPKLEHWIRRGDSGRPMTDEERGEMIAAYACARFRDGFVQPRITPADEVERAKGSSKTANRADSPWHLHPEAMWAKTAIIRLTKLLPMPDSAKRALALDELADAGIDQNLGREWQAIPSDTGATVTDVRGAAPSDAEARRRAKTMAGDGYVDPGPSDDPDADGWQHG